MLYAAVVRPLRLTWEIAGRKLPSSLMVPQAFTAETFAVTGVAAGARGLVLLQTTRVHDTIRLL